MVNYQQPLLQFYGEYIIQQQGSRNPTAESEEVTKQKLQFLKQDYLYYKLTFDASYVSVVLDIELELNSLLITMPFPVWLTAKQSILR